MWSIIMTVRKITRLFKITKSILDDRYWQQIIYKNIYD